MPVEYGTESQYSKEMRKHEAYPTAFGPAGRPYVYRPYPTQMYKAERTDHGPDIVESMRADDEQMQRNLESRGFVVGGQQAALDALAVSELEHAKLAAEREYQIRHSRLSEKAVAEVRAAEAEHGARHLPDVPETPIKRRGRKPKAEAVTQ